MKPYNPLEKTNLGKSVADSLSKQTPVLLGEIKSFEGAGIYVIYYTGSYPPYAKLRELNGGEQGPVVPICVWGQSSHFNNYSLIVCLGSVLAF